MILLLIRHGESEADLLDVHEGRADFELTERGHMQAKAMAAFVKREYQITKIYARTLKRASRTAQYLSEEIGVRVNLEENLMEFNNGLLAGMPREEAAKKYPKVQNLPIDQSVYGQESKVEFRNRAERALNQIRADADEEDVIAVITHGGMINQLYHVLLKLPIDSNVGFPTDDTGIHVFHIQNDMVYVEKANMTGHTKRI